MKKIIENPIDELEELLPAFVSLVERQWTTSKKDEVVFKIHFTDKETKELSNYEKDVNLCYHLLKSYINNIDEIENKDIDLFRIKITDDDICIYFKDKEAFSSIEFSKENFERNFDENDSLPHSKVIDHCINRIIDILKK